MILTIQEVDEIIEKELDIARTINSQMAMGMLRIKELILEEENKKINFIKSLTSAEEIVHPPFIDFSKVYK